MHALRTLRQASKLRRSQNAACFAATFKHRCNCTATATAVYVAPTEAHLQHLASLLAQEREAGDTYCLFGSVGAGKSVFSRAFIRAACDDPSLPVPSPTYLLQLVYEDQEGPPNDLSAAHLRLVSLSATQTPVTAEQGYQQGPPIHHFDLYRLDPQSDMSRLDLNSSFQSAVSLVEWSERLPQQLMPQQRLEVHIKIVHDDHHHHQQQQQQGQVAGWQDDCAGQQQQQQQQERGQETDAGQQAQASTPPTAEMQMQHQKQQRGLRQATGSSRDGVLLLRTPDIRDGKQQQDSWDTGEELYSDTEEEYEASVGELFTDSRPRRVQLIAVGHRWVARLQQLAVHQT